MDFHSLSRKELQALCKKNKIPANITNVAMADALKSLDTVEGIEEFLKASESESAQSPEKSEAPSSYVPTTGFRTTRRKAAKNESETLQSQTTTHRRSTRRTATAGEVSQPKKEAIQTQTPAPTPSRRRAPPPASARRKMETQLDECVDDDDLGDNGTIFKKDVPVTPAPGVTSRRKAAKEESTVKRVYSTRRSARLAEKDLEESIAKEEERSEPIMETESLSEQLAEKLDLNSGIELNIMSGDASDKENEELVELEEKTDILLEGVVKQLQDDDIGKDEINEIEVESSNSKPNEDEELKDEVCDGIIKDAVDDGFGHEHQGCGEVDATLLPVEDLYKPLDVKSNASEDVCLPEINCAIEKEKDLTTANEFGTGDVMPEVEQDEVQENSGSPSTDSILIETQDVITEIEQQEVHENDVCNDFKADDPVVSFDMDAQVESGEELNSGSDNYTGDENSSKIEGEVDPFAIPDSSVLTDASNSSLVEDFSSSVLVRKTNSEAFAGDQDIIEALNMEEGKGANYGDHAGNNSSDDAETYLHLLDPVLLPEQLEVETESVVLEFEESKECDDQLGGGEDKTIKMTMDNIDTKDSAATNIMEVPVSSFDFVMPNGDVTSGIQIQVPLALPESGSENVVIPTCLTPVKKLSSTKTPVKKSASKTPATIRRLTQVSDDKENIDNSGQKLSLTKEKFKEKKEITGKKKQEHLEALSLRQLTKMLKELSITKDLNKDEKDNNIKAPARRPALQVLSENHVVDKSQN